MTRRAFTRLLGALAVITALAIFAPVTAGAAGPPTCQAACTTAYAAAGQPFGLTSGPRGSEWFSLDSQVARINQQGQISTYFVRSGATVGWMTTDPSDGSVWFAERSAGRVGRITASGMLTEF